MTSPNLPAEQELAKSLAALESTAAGEGRTAALDDLLQRRDEREEAAEQWFGDAVQRLALERKRGYTSPVDALLSVRRDVRLALGASRLSLKLQERLLLIATDTAAESLLASPADRGLAL